ncbi:MAG: hypothetical protein WBD67_01185, partial [Terracidiphilus sp.]
MAKEICISSTPHETRLAILEDDQLAEIYYERENEYTLAGSIYNGRVTRVLPGMQSAFVDVGLERDAFLYVTDFLEMEDQEDSEEVEKATVSGAAQPPREVRPSERADRGDRGGRGSRPDRGSSDRGPSERRPREEALRSDSGESELAEAHFTPGPASSDDASETSDEAGAKRWRGRRRRRGGRGASADAPETTSSETESESLPNEAPRSRKPEPSHEIRAQAASAGRSERTSSPDRTSAPDRAPAFVLPGESLTKYGRKSADEEPKPTARQAPPARIGGTSRPSTLIEAPLQWDGSGLLPGESISRHRSRQPEPETASEAVTGPDAVTEEDLTEDEITEETAAPPESHAEPEAEIADDDADAEASHRVDPNPPSGFRLFGMGSKKKPGDGPREPADQPAGQRPPAPASVSAFAPGSGLVEEEVIEGEEYDLAGHPHAHRGEEHDLDEYEEQTLQAQIRSGDIGELLQEAQLDHRIDLDLDDKDGEEEDEAIEYDDAEESQGEDQHAAAPGQQ